MPGVVRYTLRHQERTITFVSFVFILRPETGTPLVPQDPYEAISDLRWVEPSTLPDISNRLRQVIRAWGGWGPYRAIVHDLVSAVLMQESEVASLAR
jgi:hypothetical protein